ncbi:MAG: hypothetical protein G8345_14670 [Magnetococcales bacterium]|nr:hypothetical protein [Magnetococcales bacterium]
MLPSKPEQSAKTPLIPVLYTTLASLLLVALAPLPWLTRVHLALAVGVMPLIFVAILYFSPTLTRTAPASGWQVAPPWLALLAGGLAVASFLVWEEVRMVALLLAMVATLWLFYQLHQRRHRCLGTPHGGLWWYQLALACLFLGLLAMGVGVLFPAYYPLARLIHLHLNLLGFVAITALGTLHVLLPTMLATFDPTTAQRLHQDWPFALAAPLLIAVGSVWWSPLAMLGGLFALVAPLQLAKGLWRLRERCRNGHGGVHSLLMALAAFLAMPPLSMLLPHHGLLVGFFVQAFLMPLISGAAAHLLPLWLLSDPQYASWRQEAQGQLFRFALLRAILFLLAAIAGLHEASWSWPLAGLAMASFLVQVGVVVWRMPCRHLPRN